MDTNKAYKQTATNQYNFSYTYSSEDHLNTLRSSRMIAGKAFAINSGVSNNYAEGTSLKNPISLNNGVLAGKFILPTKFIEDDNGLNTQRKFVPILETPKRSYQDKEEFQSKQTVVGCNFNFNLNFSYPKKINSFLDFSGEDNKENTKIFSNLKYGKGNNCKDLFSSSEEREVKNDDKEDKTDSFKVSNKKSNFTQATEGKNLFSSVRVNLQQSFIQSKENCGVNIFEAKEKENKFSNFSRLNQINKFNNLTSTLISSGFSSASQNSESSRNESQGVSQEMQISQKFDSENNSMIISRDSKGDQDSLKNLSKEKMLSQNKFNIPNNLNNPFTSYQNNKNITNYCNISGNPFMVNPSQENVTSSQQTVNTVTDSLLDGFEKKTDFFIPPERSNDEKFKLLALRKVRKLKFKDNKSISNAEIRKAEGKAALPSSGDSSMEDEPMNILDYNIFGLKRKKMAHSVKKVYASDILFTDPISYHKQSFKIYKDSEIGFGEHWQQFLHSSNGDEDVPSDDELLNRAKKHCLDNLWEAVNTIFTKQEFDKINNLHLLRKEEKSETIKGENQ